MAVRFGDEITYTGAVLNIESKYWLDGMYEEWAVVWDGEQIRRIPFGYYGIDGTNLAGGAAEIDATTETWREVLRHLRPGAYRAFADSVITYKNEVRKGSHAQVVRGRKVPKGTAVEVFWVGERPTFQSRKYSWLHETETVAGCYDSEGNKLWIKAEYLKPTDPIKSPNAKERRKFIKTYMDREARALGAPW